MRCERDTGSVRDVASAADLTAELNQVEDGGHIILGDDARFIQAAREHGAWVVQYGENGAVHEAAAPVDQGTVAAMVEGFRSGDSQWRGMISWSAGEALAPDSQDGAGGGGAAGILGAAGGLGASLGGIAKSEASRAMRRGAGRAIRQGLRRFIR